MALKDIVVTVSGGDSLTRAAVAEEFQGILSVNGFGNVTNNVFSEDYPNASEGSLFDIAKALRPDLLSTAVYIEDGEDEAEEEITESDEQEGPVED